MNQEEFERQCKEPVDINECHKALQKFIDRTFSLSVPARPDDPDMLICRAFNELVKLRGY